MQTKQTRTDGGQTDKFILRLIYRQKYEKSKYELIVYSLETFFNRMRSLDFFAKRYA